MPLFIIAMLILGIFVVIVALVGLIRVIVFAAPFGFLVAAAIYAIVRNRSRRARHHAALDALANRERELNKQEFDAWSSLVERERRNAAKRSAALRTADEARQKDRPVDRNKPPRL